MLWQWFISCRSDNDRGIGKCRYIWTKLWCDHGNNNKLTCRGLDPGCFRTGWSQPCTYFRFGLLLDWKCSFFYIARCMCIYFIETHFDGTRSYLDFSRLGYSRYRKMNRQDLLTNLSFFYFLFEKCMAFRNQSPAGKFIIDWRNRFRYVTPSGNHSQFRFRSVAF